MSQPIENYGFIGNMLSCALVGRDGSIDWLCLPRFDSAACFAALLGTRENGRWLIAPKAEARRVSRRYRDGTAILETRFETDTGAVTLIDFMPLSDEEDYVDVVRIVRGDSGEVEMWTELILRFDYGHLTPWVRRQDYGISAISGPDAVLVWTPVALRGEAMTTRGEFKVCAGESIPFTLAYYPSHQPAPAPRSSEPRLESTESWWCEWSGRCRFGENWPAGRWRDPVMRSLVTLKALSFQPTGGIVAAATTSLPEQPGGVRNWDYRYCWIRDATLTLYALLTSGYREEALAWRQWLLRAAAGSPAEMQIMYGLAGERRLTELELPWLPGYMNSRPVRIGNAAHGQFQIDIYGELMDALHVARKFELEGDEAAWQLQSTLLNHLEKVWNDPDLGIWEMRGPPQHFTHSKLMAWVAMDRAVKNVESYGLPGPVDRWRGLRDHIHADICRQGFDEGKNAFVQYYGGKALDASLLLMPELGFLPPEDPRVVGTIRAIERELLVDGLVLRYNSADTQDGLPPGEGAFLACSFWLADAYAMTGRYEEAVELFEHLLSLRNDVGLLAEEYDPRSRRQLGNFPQAFSHIGLVNTAHNLATTKGPAEHRADRRGPAGAPPQ